MIYYYYYYCHWEGLFDKAVSGLQLLAFEQYFLKNKKKQLLQN